MLGAPPPAADVSLGTGPAGGPAAPHASRPRLGAWAWPADAYRREALAERVLVLGTGMLLRSLPLALLDAANRAGRAAGRAVLVQSTGSGVADALAAQDGLYTLVERGVEGGHAVERARLAGAVSRALVARRDWPLVRAAAAHPALAAVVTNASEAGFRAHPDDARAAADDAAGRAPAGLAGKLAALLHARRQALGAAAPPLVVIPTELVDDNGAALAALVDAAAGAWPNASAFRAWVAAHVHFASSLVDRITTAADDATRAAVQQAAGYEDACVTVAEPYALWAVEGDPAALRRALPVDDGACAVFAPSIARYRERKLRLLNGTHTAAAPLALLAGLATVREAAADPAFGALLRRLLFDEIAPATALDPADARAFAAAVLDRFANPALAHAWTKIATDQTAKLRARVAPVLRAYGARAEATPPGLALALAGALVLARDPAQAVRDPEAPTVARHWVGVGDDGDGRTRVASAALADGALWGGPLAHVPGLVDAVAEALGAILRGDARAAVAGLADRARLGTPRPAAGAGGAGGA